MDFLTDSLANGQRFRVLTIVDTVSRVSPAIEVGVSLTGERVVAVLERLKRTVRRPERIAIDNGPEFISKALDAWAYQNGVQPAGRTDRQRLRRVVQRAVPGRMPESALVHVSGGGEADGRSMAAGLQPGASPSGAWAAGPSSLGSCLVTGSKGPGLTFQVDQSGGQVKKAPG